MDIIVLHTKNGDIPAIVPDAQKIRINHTVVDIKGGCKFLEDNRAVQVALGRLLVEAGRDIYNVAPEIVEESEAAE